MIPYELKYDKKGLLYLEDNHILSKHSLKLDKRGERDEYYQKLFYPIASTSDYIIKYNCTFYTRKQIKQIKEMLSILVDKQKNITSVDFPIAYFVYMKRLAGLIVRYYKDGISCDNIMNLKDINAIGKFYYHDEDNIHNMFILFDELLNIVNELYDNGIYYTDLNPGNIVLSNNQVKLIDFDYRLVFFDKKDEKLFYIMLNYLSFIKESLKSVGLYNDIDEYYNFDDAKKYLKKLENKVRRG